MYTIVIGAQTLHATGYAMGIAKDGKVGSDDGGRSSPTSATAPPARAT